MKFNSQFYSLEVLFAEPISHMCMKMKTPILSTRALPFTKELLQSHFPGVLKTRCFNDKHLPFSVEVLKTEIGHLFEHILLRYMLELKLQYGEKDYVVNGLTSWNWMKEARGTFNITISTEYEDIHMFYNALQKSMHLMDLVLNTNTFSALPSQNKDNIVPILA